MHRNINLVQTIKGHSRKPCSRVFHCLHNSSLMVRRACPAELYLTICQWLQRVVTAGHVKSRLSFSGMRLSIRPGDSFGGGKVGSLQPGVGVGGWSGWSYTGWNTKDSPEPDRSKNTRSENARRRFVLLLGKVSEPGFNKVNTTTSSKSCGF